MDDQLNWSPHNSIMVKLSNKTAGYQHKQADYIIPVAGTDGISAITTPGSDV